MAKRITNEQLVERYDAAILRNDRSAVEDRRALAIADRYRREIDRRGVNLTQTRATMRSGRSAVGDRREQEYAQFAAEAEARRRGAAYAVVGRGETNPDRQPLLFEYHAHSDPSHHVGSCDESCRAGRAPHAHRLPRNDPLYLAQKRAQRTRIGRMAFPIAVGIVVMLLATLVPVFHAWDLPIAPVRSGATHGPIVRSSPIAPDIHIQPLVSSVTPTWVTVCTGSGGAGKCIPQPTSRAMPGFTWDAADGYALLFGGGTTATGGFQNDSWTWTVNHHWTLLTTPVAPVKVANLSMVYDSTDGYVLEFGGYTGALAYSNLTWRFSAGVWTKLTVNTGLQQLFPRSGACMMNVPSVNSHGGYVILFGGKIGSVGAGQYLSDTWKYSGGTWTNITSLVGTAPSGRVDAFCRYDAADSYGVLFGGATGPSTFVNDTWKFDPTLGTTGQWTNLNLAMSPTPRFLGPMTYDTAIGKIVLYGGGKGTVALPTAGYVDTWTFVGGAWTNVTATAGNKNPTGTWGAVAADLPTSPVAVFFGGRGSGAMINLTSEFGPLPALNWAQNIAEVVVGAGHGPVKFYANASGGNGVYSYAYTGLPTGCTTSNVSLLTCVPTAAGKYTAIVVNVTDSSGLFVLSGSLTLMVDALGQLNGSVAQGGIVAKGLLASTFWGVKLGTNAPINSSLDALLNATPIKVVRYGNSVDGQNVTAGCIYVAGTSGASCSSLTATLNYTQLKKLQAFGFKVIVTVPAEPNDKGEAAQFVTYLETTIGMHPDYWSLGNEPTAWTHFNIAQPSWKTSDNSVPTHAQYSLLVANLTAAIHSVDPAAVVIADQAADGATNSGPWFYDLVHNDTNFNGLAFHTYPAGGGSSTGVTYSGFLGTTGLNLITTRWTQATQNVSAGCSGVLTCLKPIAVDEWNTGAGASNHYTIYEQNFPEVPYLGAAIAQSLTLGVPRFTFFDFYNDKAFAMVNGTTTDAAYVLYASVLKFLPIANSYSTNLTTGVKNVFAVSTFNGSSYARVYVNANVSVALNENVTGVKGNYSWTVYSDVNGSVSTAVYANGSQPTRLLVPPMSVVVLTTPLYQNSSGAGGFLTLAQTNVLVILEVVSISLTIVTFLIWVVAHRRSER